MEAYIPTSDEEEEEPWQEEMLEDVPQPAAATATAPRDAPAQPAVITADHLAHALALATAQVLLFGHEDGAAAAAAAAPVASLDQALSAALEVARAAVDAHLRGSLANFGGLADLAGALGGLFAGFGDAGEEDAADADADLGWTGGWLPSHFLPSQTPASRGSWISVENPRDAGRPRATAAAVAAAVQEDGLTADLLAIFRAGLDAEAAAPRSGRVAAREATIAAMRARMARAVGGVDTRGGKWVKRVHREHADAMWSLVTRLVTAGALGPAAKISTADPSGPPVHVLIVYTADFMDTADVRRVLDVLVAAGIAPAAGTGPVIGYKPGALTALDILVRVEEQRAAWRLTIANATAAEKAAAAATAAPEEATAAAAATDRALADGAAAAAALAEATATKEAWERGVWKAWRTIYQSDRPDGRLAKGKLRLPTVPGSVEAAAAAVAAARAAIAAEAVAVLSDDEDEQHARGAQRQRVE